MADTAKPTGVTPQETHENFIVRFKKNTSQDVINKAKTDIKNTGGKIKHEYTLFKGFLASIPKGHVGTLESHPDVEGVEKDQEVHTQASS